MKSPSGENTYEAKWLCDTNFTTPLSTKMSKYGIFNDVYDYVVKVELARNTEYKQDPPVYVSKVRLHSCTGDVKVRTLFESYVQILR